MDLEMLQIKNEYAFDKQHTVETLQLELEDTFKSHVDNYVKLLKDYYAQDDFTYTLKDGTIKVWASKQDRFNEMHELDIAEIAWHCLVHCITQKDTTFTQVIGKFYKRFGHETDRQNLESASEFIAILNQTPFINVIYPANSEEGVLMIHSNIKLGKRLEAYLDNQRFTLPSLIEPMELTNNKQTGYESIGGSVLLGGRHHDNEVCLDHINRVNKVKFSLETRIFKKANPVFKDKDETEIERQKRLDNFKQCNRESGDIYARLVKAGNEFYLTNRYCSRGRTYAHGYHLNSQGDNFRKGVLVLAEKELVQI
jgi:hypothetical protein